MPAERYFSSHLSPQKDEISIQGDEYHHIIHVMRTREGDVVEFVDGKGMLATARLISLDKQKALFSVLKVHQAQPSSQQLVLVQAMPKIQHLEFIVEKGTELGMTSLWLFPGNNSEKEGLSANQQERISSILIASMKQCGRLFLPTVELKPKLSTWKDFPKYSYYGDVRPQAVPFIRELEKNPKDSVYFFVGPEAGFSDGEVASMERGGVKGVHLHENILRTETAGMVALVLASTR